MNRVAFQDLKINGRILIHNRGAMKIGAKSVINSSKYKNIIGGDTRSSIVVKKGAQLSIGKGFKMSNSALYCAKRICIGDHVMIGGNCKIWDTDFHPLDPKKREHNPNENYQSKQITIEDNVFIGGSSIILKGVTIGNGAIIGAGSVVAKSIPAKEVWGGNPARFIKKVGENV